jgi:hypothetical protein
MNKHTKDFLTKLAILVEEYGANMEIEGDCYSGGPMQVSFEVNNPQTFDEHLYSHAEWTDLGFHCNAEGIRKLTGVVDEDQHERLYRRNDSAK